MNFQHVIDLRNDLEKGNEDRNSPINKVLQTFTKGKSIDMNTFEVPIISEDIYQRLFLQSSSTFKIFMFIIKRSFQNRYNASSRESEEALYRFWKLDTSFHPQTIIRPQDAPKT